MVRHAADVDEAVLVDADIDEGAKIHDVADGSFEFHSRREVSDGEDVGLEYRFRHVLPRVSGGFLEFCEDVTQRDLSDADALRCALLILHEEACHAERGRIVGESEAVQKSLHGVIVLRMDSGGIERFLSSLDAQEPGALLKGLRPEFRHLEELAPALEAAVGLAVRDDVLRERGRNARDIRE